MMRKDAKYKLALEYARNASHNRLLSSLESNKHKLKSGKADTLLNFYVNEQISDRTLLTMIILFIESYDSTSSHLGFEEIEKVFKPGISIFKGTLYLKINKIRYENFSIAGVVTALITNNSKICGTLNIKTKSGLTITLDKNYNKAEMFIIKKTHEKLPYNISRWTKSYLSILCSGLPSRRRLLDTAEATDAEILEAEVAHRNKSLLELFLETRTMNTEPSKKQLAKINKQKKKLFGPEITSEIEEIQIQRPTKALRVGFNENIVIPFQNY